MAKRSLTSMAMLALSAGLATTAGAAAGDRLEVGRMPRVAQVDPRFQSYNIEMAEIVGGRFWAPYPSPGARNEPENTEASGGLALAANLFSQRPPANLVQPRLRNLARALGPAYIRVSGSWANALFFQDDALPPLAKPPKGFQNVLTRPQWAGLVAFAKAVDGQIVTSFSVSDGARDATGAWQPDEARKLLRYTRALGGRIHAAELINEPNLGGISGLTPGYDAARFARDSATFRAFARREAPGLKIVGPGSSGEEKGDSALPFPGQNIATEAMLSAQPHPQFDIFSYHFYGARSERCAKMMPNGGTTPDQALDEEWLGRTDAALAFYRKLRDRYAPGTPIWLNETAQASCGGDRWAASFLDSFRYVDQLGRLARQGVAAVFHNTLAASDYGLIDGATMTPRPNYWAAVLWRRLMGTVVLDASPAPQPNLHIYAHCLRDRPGGVALVALNLDRSRAASLSLPAAVERYALTGDSLQGGSVKLNGRPLALNGDRLPEIRPDRSPAGAVTLEPASITFLAMPGTANPACR